MSSFTIRVPGKAMLAGEYAVLAGAPGVVCAVRRYLWCEAAPAPRWSVEGAGHLWHEGEPEPVELRFALEARRVAASWLRLRGNKPAPLALRLRDELRTPDGSKLGLGGSACTTAAVAAATLVGAGAPLGDKRVLLKLAALAHATAQGRAGSGLDVIGTVLGGTQWARRFPVEALQAVSATHTLAWAGALERAELPELERLRDPAGLLLAFSGASASTAVLMEKVEHFRKQSPRGFATFLARTAAATDGLRRGLGAGDTAAAMRAFAHAGELLEELGREAHVELVTSGHREIQVIAEREGAAAKVSGAGGGDCAAVLGEPAQLERVRAALAAAGVYAFEAQVDPEGVSVEAP